MTLSLYLFQLLIKWKEGSYVNLIDYGPADYHH